VKRRAEQLWFVVSQKRQETKKKYTQSGDDWRCDQGLICGSDSQVQKMPMQPCDRFNWSWRNRAKLNGKNLFFAFWVLLALFGHNNRPQNNGPSLFNRGRNDVFSGFCFSKDGKTLYYAPLYKPDSIAPYSIKISKISWNAGKWSTPEILDLGDGTASFPVLSENEDFLYFSSNALLPGAKKGGDLNIWRSQKKDGKWAIANPVQVLNSAHNERISHIDKDGTIYITSDRNGTYDVFCSKMIDGTFSTPMPMILWNSPMNEEHVAVYEDLGITFLQRTEVGIKTTVFYSLKKDGAWTALSPLVLNEENGHLSYAQSLPKLSPDGSTFYTIRNMKLWQQSFDGVMQRNGIQLRQKPPAHQLLTVAEREKTEAEVFYGDQLQTNNGISFTPDMKTIYLSRYTAERDSAGNPFIKLFESHWKHGKWTSPQAMPINHPSVPFEYHPVLSPDGKRLLFNSCAAEPGEVVKYHSHNNIWYADKLPNNEWSTPKMIKALATTAYDDYVSVTRTGTLYFRSDRPGGKGAGDIYKSRYENGHYQAPEPVSALNSAYDENDLCIDPDERFIIFNRYFAGSNEIQLFISNNTQNGWSSPRPLPFVEQRASWELTPTLSPNGKYFFYEVNSNILRIETKTLMKGLLKR
jgi:hypothetical protein